MSRWLVLASMTLAMACASASQGGGGESSRSSRSVITAEEIEAQDIQHLDAYSVVERLRANWLLPQRASSPSDAAAGPILPVVYVDNIRLGEIETLRSVPAGDIADLRLLNERDATFRYGTGHIGGAITVTTKR